MRSLRTPSVGSRNLGTHTANTGLLGVDLQKSPQKRVIGDQVTKVEGYWENRRAIGDQVTKVEGYWGPSDQSGGLLGIIPKVVGLLGTKLASWRVIGDQVAKVEGYWGFWEDFGSHDALTRTLVHAQ